MAVTVKVPALPTVKVVASAEVTAALDGTVATQYAEGNREYDVRVMLPRDRFTSAEHLGDVALFPGGAGRSPVYLRDVATVSTTLGPTEIVKRLAERPGWRLGFILSWAVAMAFWQLSRVRSAQGHQPVA